MKYQKIIAWIVFIICSHNLSAKNKQQIFLTNEYGDEVIVKLTWKSNNFPYLSSDEVINLREYDKNFMAKAPYSYYKLAGLSVTPKQAPEQVTNIESNQQEYEIPLVALNEDTLSEKHIRNHTYFIIKASHKDSAVPGQKKIYMQGYASQEKYTSEIIKTEQNLKQTAQQAIPVVHTIPVASPINMPTPVQQTINPTQTAQNPNVSIHSNMNNARQSAQHNSTSYSRQQPANVQNQFYNYSNQPESINTRTVEVDSVYQNNYQRSPSPRNYPTRLSYNDNAQQAALSQNPYANSQPINLPYRYDDAFLY